MSIWERFLVRFGKDPAEKKGGSNTPENGGWFAGLLRVILSWFSSGSSASKSEGAQGLRNTTKKKSFAPSSGSADISATEHDLVISQWITKHRHKVSQVNLLITARSPRAPRLPDLSDEFSAIFKALPDDYQQSLKTERGVDFVESMVESVRALGGDINVILGTEGGLELLKHTIDALYYSRSVYWILLEQHLGLDTLEKKAGFVTRLNAHSLNENEVKIYDSLANKIRTYGPLGTSSDDNNESEIPELILHVYSSSSVETITEDNPFLRRFLDMSLEEQKHLASQALLGGRTASIFILNGWMGWNTLPDSPCIQLRSKVYGQFLRPHLLVWFRDGMTSENGHGDGYGKVAKNITLLVPYETHLAKGHLGRNRDTPYVLLNLLNLPRFLNALDAKDLTDDLFDFFSHLPIGFFDNLDRMAELLGIDAMTNDPNILSTLWNKFPLLRETPTEENWEARKKSADELAAHMEELLNTAENMKTARAMTFGDINQVLVEEQAQKCPGGPG